MLVTNALIQISRVHNNKSIARVKRMILWYLLVLFHLLCSRESYLWRLPLSKIMIKQSGTHGMETGEELSSQKSVPLALRMISSLAAPFLPYVSLHLEYFKGVSQILRVRKCKETVALFFVDMHPAREETEFSSIKLVISGKGKQNRGIWGLIFKWK